MTTFMQKAIASKKPISEMDKLNISLQLAEGINFSHQRKIIHRDLKPDNVFINREGVVKIGDYGCSKKLDEVLAEESEVFQTRMIGTPAFTAEGMETGEYT